MSPATLSPNEDEGNSKFAALEGRLGIQFRNPAVIDQAFVHRSYLNENREAKSSNERLEFFGDQVIGFAVTRYLYSKFPIADEGQLTNYRSALVSRKFLGEVGKVLNLGQYLYLARGEQRAKGRDNPVLLSNTFEALVGAIYLDQGMEAASAVVEKLVLSQADSIASDKRFQDHKSILQEAVQGRYHVAPVYKTILQQGPEHAKLYRITVAVKGKVVGIGEGKNKREAEQNAAIAALERLKG